MDKIKKILSAIVNAFQVVGGFLLVVAWCVTFVSISFGLAAWSWGWCDRMFALLLG